jgi:hypothetical protein
MKLTPEALYLQLGKLVAEMPDLASAPITQEFNQWLGRAFVLVEAAGGGSDAMSLQTAANHLDGFLRPVNAQTIAAIVHRALAKAEMNAPAGATGAFIAAGGSFDAFAAVGKVVARAKSDLFIVDPYADEKALTDFAVQAQDGVTVRLLADQKDHKASLKPAVQNWIKQFGTSRPLDVRLATPKNLHDRLIFIDGGEAWSLTQSLNAFASRSPASIVRINDEIVGMKIAAYESIWTVAQPL